MPKRKNNWRQSRQTGKLTTVENHYIFCQGRETEVNYMQGLREEIHRSAVANGKIKIIKGCAGLSPNQVIEYAKKYIQHHNITDSRIWCLFDKDDFKNEEFNAAATASLTTNHNRLTPIWSNECFELWLLYHFEPYKAQGGRTEYLRRLNAWLEKAGNKEYAKNDEKIYSAVQTCGCQAKAVQHAKKVYADFQNAKTPPAKARPATTMFLLAEALEQMKGNKP